MKEHDVDSCKVVERCATGVIMTIWMLAVVFFLVTMLFGDTVYGCDEDCTQKAIKVLQPHMDDMRAARLAHVYTKAGAEVEIDHVILVAITRRESSFWLSVEMLKRFGRRGEIGLMQIMPGNSAALRQRPRECPETLVGADCQVRTGARWLAQARKSCPGTPWRWVAAYGHGWRDSKGRWRCPTEAEARVDINAYKAFRYYVAVTGNSW